MIMKSIDIDHRCQPDVEFILKAAFRKHCCRTFGLSQAQLGILKSSFYASQRMNPHFFFLVVSLPCPASLNANLQEDEA